MANITLRTGRTSNLSAAQVDANFTAINAELVQATAAVAALAAVVGDLGPGTGSDVTPIDWSLTGDFTLNRRMPKTGFYQQAGPMSFDFPATGAVEDNDTNAWFIADGSQVSAPGFLGTEALAGITAGQQVVLNLAYSGGVRIVTPRVIGVTGAVPSTMSAPVVSTSQFGASFAFSPPSSPGSSSIIDYRITIPETGETFTGTASPIVATGLTALPRTAVVAARNSVGSGTASAPSAQFTPQVNSYYGQIASRCYVNQEHNTGLTAVSFRRQHVNAEACTRLYLRFDNWYVDGYGAGNTFTEKGSGGTSTWTASVEYPEGTRNQVVFSSGTTGTAADGDSVWGYVDVAIPANTPYWEWSFQRNSAGVVLAGTGNSSSSTVTPTFLAAIGDAVEAGQLTDKTMSGTLNGTGNGNAGGATLIVAQMTKPSVLEIGTSITHGEGGAQDNSTGASTGAEGEISRSVAGLFGYTNVGVRADSVYSFNQSHTKRVAMAAYFTDIIFGGPANELLGNTRSASEINALMQTQFGYFPNKRLWQCTPTPVGGSNSGQTAATNNTTRVQLRALIKGTQPLLTGGVFDIGPALEGVEDSGVVGDPTWFSDSGTHPSRLGYVQIKSSGRLDASRIVRAPGSVTTTPPITASTVPGAPTISAGTPTSATIPANATAPTTGPTPNLYSWERKLTSAADSTYVVAGTTPDLSATPDFTYSGLTANTGYSLRLRASADGGTTFGSYSNVATASTAAASSAGFARDYSTKPDSTTSTGFSGTVNTGSAGVLGISGGKLYVPPATNGAHDVYEAYPGGSANGVLTTSTNKGSQQGFGQTFRFIDANNRINVYLDNATFVVKAIVNGVGTNVLVVFNITGITSTNNIIETTFDDDMVSCKLNGSAVGSPITLDAPTMAALGAATLHGVRYEYATDDQTYNYCNFVAS